LFIVSAPSGTGKTTVVNLLMKADSRFARSISMTTRTPRGRERNGRDYWFVSEAYFKKQIRRGAFLEYARLLGSYYGTPKAPIAQALKAGRNALMSIDIQGTRQVKQCGLPLTTIFLLPPSFKIVEQRLRKRGTETPREIADRLKLARKELTAVNEYDYAVINGHLRETTAAIRTIMRAQRHRVQ
jgi:guanylate kinase